MNKLDKVIYSNTLIYIVGVESLFLIKFLEKIFRIPQDRILNLNSPLYITKGKSSGVVSKIGIKNLREGWADGADSYFMFKNVMPFGITFVVHPAISSARDFLVKESDNVLGCVLLKSNVKSIVQDKLASSIIVKFLHSVSLCQEGVSTLPHGHISESRIKTFRNLISVFECEDQKHQTASHESLDKKKMTHRVNKEFDSFFFECFESKILQKSSEIDFDDVEEEINETFELHNVKTLVANIQLVYEKKNNAKEYTSLTELSILIKEIIIKHIDYVKCN